MAAAAAAPPPSTISPGNGTIYLGSYSGHITAINEATGSVSTLIPLKNGLPLAMRLSADRSRFYVQSANQERFEIIDLATRQTLDTFTLTEGNRQVRALAYDVDPQHRFLVLVARTATKQIDRFEIGTPEFIQYDLKEHKVVRTVPWTADPEPPYWPLNLRFSPNGKYLYVFAHEILVLDAATLQQVDSWNLSLTNESGLNRFNAGSLDENYDEPGHLNGLFTMKDRVQNRTLLVIARMDLSAKNLDFFPIGPATENGDLSFAIGADRKFGYILREEIGEFEVWTVDMTAKRVQSKVSFAGRPRMAIRSSSNGKVIYIYEAGNTIDLYTADGFKFLRRIALDADMMSGTFYVVPAAGRPSSAQ
jgi:DNA-binding beta-propeller fold protein YncE